MTKEITKANILQEIQDKFKLRDFVSEKFLFSELVVPTYDIGRHLTRTEIKTKTVSITSATLFGFYTVPQTEQWTFHRYTAIFLGAGAIKMAGCVVYRGATLYTYLDLTKNQTVSYMNDLPKDLVLHPGDSIGMVCDDYTSTQDFLLLVDVTVEETR